jgi:hypothetical protein
MEMVHDRCSTLLTEFDTHNQIQRYYNYNKIADPYHKGNNKITELRTIFQRENQNS